MPRLLALRCAHAHAPLVAFVAMVLVAVSTAAFGQSEESVQSIEQPKFNDGDRLILTSRMDSDPSGNLLSEDSEVAVNLKTLMCNVRITTMQQTDNGRSKVERTHLVSSYTVSRFLLASGAQQTIYQPNPLDDQVILSTRSGDSWSHTIENTLPTLDQEQKLDAYRTIENQVTVPRKPIALGEIWDIPPQRVFDMFGLEDIGEPSGRGTLTFDRISENEDGTKHAIVEMNIKVSGLEPNETGEPFKFTLEFRGSQRIDLESMLPVRTELTGTISLDGALQPGQRLVALGPARLVNTIERITDE